ncbi:hypothetical protein BH23PLA1_BH23PLA1_24940 [soil metagenome]
MNALALRISALMALSMVGSGLVAPDEAPPFRPSVDRYGIVELPADRANLQGERFQLSSDRTAIVDWVDPREHVVWEFLLPESGPYAVLVEYAAPGGRGGCLFAVEIAGQVRQGHVHATGRDDRFLPQLMMTAVELESGVNRLVVRAVETPRGFVMNLRRVRLVPAAGG